MRSLAVVAALAGCVSLDDRHIGTSYAITFSTAAVARHERAARWKAAVIGVAMALALGTAKELRDHDYSWDDQASNAIGAATGALVVFTF